MVGHDAPNMDSDYWRRQYGALHEENVNLKNHIRLLESWLRINDVYLDSTAKTLAHLQGLMSEITNERVKA